MSISMTGSDCMADKKYARFEIPKIKRKAIDSAEVYDGEKCRGKAGV